MLQIVLQLGLNTNDLKLITALIVAVFLAIPYWKSKMFRRKFGVSPRDYRKRFIAAESMQNLHRQFAFPSDR